MADQPERDPHGHQIGPARRAAHALRLRLEGRSFGEIAEELGYGSKSAAYDAYRTALDWANVDLPIAEIVQEEALKLDAYAAKLASLNEPRAIEVLVKVAERKAKLLGLDAPEKKQITAAVGVTDLRVQEVDEDFVARVITGLDQISRPALVADNGQPLDSPQADSEAGGVPSSRTA